MKPILISGIQPTGRLHLGNYLGALKNFVDLQNSGKYDCYFFVADLHALTENPEAKNLRANVINLTADFLAIGLNSKESILFQQSQIGQVQELKLILGPLTPISELIRMTAFKEKVLQRIEQKTGEKLTEEKIENIAEESNFGLVEYPILMAADILLYDAQFVPVGEDQLQHLEFARTLARKFNKKFGKTFVEPKALLTSTSRVMSLDNPQKKMSKSLPAGCLFIDDEPNTIKERIKRAVTDSGNEIKYDEKNKPAISNLLSIYSALSGESVTRLEKKFAGKNYSYFKTELAESINKHFKDFRVKKTALLKKPATLKKTFAAGSKKARLRAEKKIKEVKKKIGLI
ncbi:MAG: Tryptophan-tRNA ligase [Parcubacteria group bacterium GW2011_GWB1_45_9]|nr:MAG: Tryptophan-tRNA ligase [Parcubacteria group bacterium GW2011_GWB1_45_9]